MEAVFSETSVQTRATGAKSQKASAIDAAMKASQRICVLRPYIASLYGVADQQ
jgi:hypothetical protein